MEVQEELDPSGGKKSFSPESPFLSRVLTIPTFASSYQMMF